VLGGRRRHAPEEPAVSLSFLFLSLPDGCTRLPLRIWHGFCFLSANHIHTSHNNLVSQAHPYSSTSPHALPHPPPPHVRRCCRPACLVFLVQGVPTVRTHTRPARPSARDRVSSGLPYRGLPSRRHLRLPARVHRRPVLPGQGHDRHRLRQRPRRSVISSFLSASPHLTDQACSCCRRALEGSARQRWPSAAVGVRARRWGTHVSLVPALACVLASLTTIHSALDSWLTAASSRTPNQSRSSRGSSSQTPIPRASRLLERLAPELRPLSPVLSF
jgi:hypothetical protein